MKRAKDEMFVLVWLTLCGVMVLFGVGTLVLIITQDPSPQTQWRLIGAWVSQFTAVAGLALGYLAGMRNGNGKGSA